MIHYWPPRSAFAPCGADDGLATDPDLVDCPKCREWLNKLAQEADDVTPAQPGRKWDDGK